MKNVVDTCGWISYFFRDKSAGFFGNILEQTEALLVPSIVVYEVSKRLSQAYDQDTYDRAMRYLKLGQFVGADWDLMAQAALTSRRYKLHMADAIIWQTAQANSATLYTQDAAFDGLTGVVYQPKSS